MRRPGRPRIWLPVTLAALLLPAVAPAGTVEVGAEGTRLAHAFLSRTPVADPVPGMRVSDAYDVQRRFVRLIVPSFGAPVGYKAALTSPEAQARFQVEQPVSGVLLRRMLLRDGAELPAAFGARPFMEADLLVRIGSESINTARDADEALAALDAVIPFLELPDLVYASGTQPDGPALVAINAGARHGVVGEPIPLAAADDWPERLREFRALFLDGEGSPRAVGRGRALMGDPLAVVLWLRDEMRDRKIWLNRGEVLSLGSLTPPLPAEPGTWTVRYTGLDPAGPVEVGVHLVPAPEAEGG